jgi:hypothetical protein
VEGYNRVYAGGIAGFNGGEIADCYSTGGIYAGESAANTNGVSGYAGGIAGSSGGTILRSYAAGTVSAANTSNSQGGIHAGGIAAAIGDSGSALSQPPTNRVVIQACAALNTKIIWKGYSKDDTILRRIANFAKFHVSSPFTDAFIKDVTELYPEYNDLINNIANAAMVIDYQPTALMTAKQAAPLPAEYWLEGANAKDGADAAAKPAQNVFAGMGWDFGTVWTMGGNGYPVLQWE